MSYDIFISHASEDKSDIAEPLAQHLKKLGLKVWLDKFELTVGDSLRRSIDQGLAQSRFGVVVLSHNFFKKEWPQRELDGLAARDDGKEKVLLPIWHNITSDEVTRFSPMLADRLGVSTRNGIKHVSQQILRAIKRENEPRMAKRKGSSNKAQRSIYKYDAFLSSPVTSFQPGRKYQAHRKRMLRLKDMLIQQCKLKKIFYPGVDTTNYRELKLPDIAVKDGFKAIEESKYYILVYPDHLLSSVLVEAGYALALGKYSIYFVRDKNDLPYLLRVANQVFSFVKVYEYKDFKDLGRLIQQFGVRILIEDAAD